jgi:hypothetical protein
VRKVTSGAPVIMGTTSSVYRGRMPVFSYLSENEAADVYEYLTRYPPAELANLNQTLQTSRRDPTDPPTDPRGARVTAPQPAPSQVLVPGEQAESVALLTSVGLFVVALLMLACWITLHEFRRLSVESQARGASRSPGIEPAPWVTLHPTVELLMDSPSLCAESVERNSDWMEEGKVS